MTSTSRLIHEGMAKYEIKAKDDNSVRYSGYPKYNGTYMKVSYLDFGNISSPVLIGWKVGDYVDYDRTGMRYRLYSIPQPTKQARAGASGESFMYKNVQFHAKTHDLQITPFRDYVRNDNLIHFSTSSSVSTYENVYGIADRIQACLDDMFPGEWSVRVYEALDDDFIEKISESMDFSISGTLLDACNKMYEQWGIGWSHVIEDGKDVLLFGRSNKRDSTNTSAMFEYGKGRKLTSIVKSTSNKDDLATRLYIYGSTRNMPNRYYNSQDIKDAESVDIRNLMIPLSKWGMTDGKPDARLAYIENPDAVEQLGLIPKIIYFDGSDSQYPEVYPSIEGRTIQDLWDVMQPSDKYYPKPTIYDGEERIDEALSATNPEDGGNYDDVLDRKIIDCNSCVDMPVEAPGSLKDPDPSFAIIDSLSLDATGSVTLRFDQECQIKSNFNYAQDAKALLKVYLGGTLVQSIDVENPVFKSNSPINTSVLSFTLPQIEIEYNAGEVIKCILEIVLPRAGSGAATRSYTLTVPERNDLVVAVINALDSDFTMTIRQLGFDIDELVAMTSEGKGVISMRTGKCAGREFTIKDAIYESANDRWRLGLERVKDESLGLYFPNDDYKIAAGDRFVILGIAMPDTYITMAEDRLYEYGQSLYGDISRMKPFYEPAINAKEMASSPGVLIEGMYMHIHDEDIVTESGHDDYILIDSIVISEGEEAIPTYKVTLREKKAKTFQQTVTDSISDLQEKTSGTSGGIINTDYANRAGSSDYASNAERWASYRYPDRMDQPVRTFDDVKFNKVTAGDVQSSDYENGWLGSGYKLGKNSSGDSIIEVDVVTVRKRMEVYELVIQQLEYQGGIVFYTAAAIECTEVEDADTGYKCFFDTKDGSVENLFKAGDMARCQRFDTGTTEAKYYWRYVSEVGEDYIVLSKTDCDSGSGIPEAGDIIVQLGNKSDTSRQAAKVTTVTGTDTPRDDYYQGINSYSLSEKLVTTIGVKEGIVGVFTKNGSFEGNVVIGPGSSGLENLKEWSQKQEKLDSIDDLNYLKETFGYIVDVNGVVLGKLVAVRDGNGNITAMMNGSDLGKDTGHGKLLLAGGIEDMDHPEAAKTRIYEDGHIASESVELTGKINAESGKIGSAMEIDDMWLYMKLPNNEKVESGISPSKIYFENTGESNYESSFTAQAYPTPSGGSASNFICQIKSSYLGNENADNVALLLSVTGNSSRNIAISCLSGMFAGLRPNTRVLTGSDHLSELDNIIICVGPGAMYVYLPTSPQNGQVYQIWQAGNCERRINGQGKSINWTGVQTGAEQILGTTDYRVVHLVWHSNMGYWMMYASPNN